jgi:hypothetical protein
MALEVGEPIVTGIAEGISNNAFRIANAVRAAMPTASTMGSTGPSPMGVAIGSGLLPPVAVGTPASAQGFNVGGDRQLIFPIVLNGRELGRAVLAEAELLRRLRGGNLAGAAG